MKKPRHPYLATGAILLVSAGAWGEGGNVKVIANPSLKENVISTDELKSIFLEETNALKDGTHVEPVLKKDGPAHEWFVKTYLGKSNAALQSYYRSLVFTGKASMPKAFNSDAEMLAYVARTKGAIGYVNPDASTEGVKTLNVK